MLFPLYTDLETVPIWRKAPHRKSERKYRGSALHRADPMAIRICGEGGSVECRRKDHEFSEERPTTPRDGPVAAPSKPTVTVNDEDSGRGTLPVFTQTSTDDRKSTSTPTNTEQVKKKKRISILRSDESEPNVTQSRPKPNKRK